MNAQTFLDNFGYIANAPKGVQRLRELILQLAVQGKLVGQDKHEGTALADIQASDKPLRDPTLADTESVPLGWINVSLDDITTSNTGGGTPSKQNPDYWSGSIPWASVKDIQTDKYLSSTIDSITEAGLKKSSSNLIPPYRLIVVTRMGLGKLAINTIPVAINQDLRAFSFSRAVFLDYAYLLFKSIRFEGSGMTVKGIKQSDLHAIKIALPPHAEQKRIVAKVEELMALCDKLEALQQKREKLCELSRTTTLNALANAQSQSELLSAWNRTQRNMTVLFDTPQTVEELRHVIMFMAIRGHLTERTSSNAQELLDECREYKVSLIKSEKIKRPKPFKKLSNYPFEIPRNWTWARFSEIGFFGRGISKHRPRNDARLFLDGKYPFIQTGDVARSVGKGIRVFSKKYGEFGLQQSKLWPPGTLCITIAANIADSAILKIEACFPDSVVGSIPFEIVGNVEYFDFFVRTAKSDLAKFAPATAQKNINLGILEEVAIPLPPREEMEEIVQKSTELLKFCNFLESRLSNVKSTAALFATSAVAAITGTQIEEKEKMKAPKMELVSKLKVGSSPKPKDQAPLTSLLTNNQGELSAKALWSHSGLKIDEFYLQLKTEMANGWIVEPEKAVMREVTAD